MPYYLPAYDTEQVFPWWDAAKYKSWEEAGGFTGELKDLFLAGVRAVVDVHLELQAPATFFVVAKFTETAGPELRRLLDHPLFDIQCHSYSHKDMVPKSGDAAFLRQEITDAKKKIEDCFGRPVSGFTTPGAYTRGLCGQPRMLEALVTAGFRFVRSVGRGPAETVPAPLTQPYWYTADGFPDLLELGLHAWHDNVLTGQAIPVWWPPVLPWGLPPRVAVTAEEAYRAYAPGIDWIKQQNLLTYVPCFHPWSIYRLNPRAEHIRMLVAEAQAKVTVISCAGMAAIIRAKRQLAAEMPTIIT